MAEALRQGRFHLATTIEDAAAADPKDQKKAQDQIDHSRVFCAQIRAFEAALEGAGRHKNEAHQLTWYLSNKNEVPSEEEIAAILAKTAKAA